MSLLALHHFTAGLAPGGTGRTPPEDRPCTAQELSEFRRRRERLVDEELAQSFPASDPPSWVQGTAPEPS